MTGVQTCALPICLCKEHLPWLIHSELLAFEVVVIPPEKLETNVMYQLVRCCNATISQDDTESLQSKQVRVLETIEKIGIELKQKLPDRSGTGKKVQQLIKPASLRNPVQSMNEGKCNSWCPLTAICIFLKKLNEH